MASLTDWGIWYGKMGLANFPVYLDKNPCTPHGFYNAEKDPEKVKKLFGEYPQAAGIAIATGEASGNVFVLDLDHHPDRGIDGIELSEEWQEENGPFPETWTAVSGSGGRHLYFLGDGSVDSCRNEDVGVDIRGNFGYAVAPPSKHPSGGCYFWDLAPNDIQLAEANESVYGFMKAYRKEQDKEQKFHLPAEIKEGCRNNVLFSAACSMQAQGYPDSVIEIAIRELNRGSCKPPLKEREVDIILKSVEHYEKGGGVDRWTMRAELQKKEILMELKDQLKKSQH